ncbi:MAG: diguanylate cyclase [Rhodoferax sp.]|uniref:diguanylate cyclase domain-containing protein n=1 Tax=Rhodoferax sp. TaxID=50421 RepID=UPI0032654FBC
MLVRFSLRQWLTIPYVALVLGVATLVGALSYRTGSEVVDTLSSHLLLETVARIEQAVDRHLLGSAAVLETAFPHGQGTTANLLDDQAALRARFWAATALYTDPNNHVYYANVAGQVASMYRRGTDLADWATRSSPLATRLVSTVRGIDGPLTDSHPGQGPLDLRLRPWYTLAETSTTPVWTAVYIDGLTNELVLTRAKRVLDGQGSLQGVVATDVALTRLNAFVRTLALSEHGLAFIIETGGQLIASSHTPNIHHASGKVGTRINASASGDPLQEAAYRAVLERLKTYGEPQIPVSMPVSGPDGVAVQLAFSRLRDDAGLDWLVVVAVPRSDFMRDLSANVVRTAVIGAAASIAAVALGLLILNWLSADLHLLTVAARGVGEGRLDAVVNVQGRGTIGELAQTFREMQLRLRTDALTGLHNREWLMRTLGDRLDRGRRQADQQPFAVLFIDLNKFKHINDTLGHDAGDQVLVATADRLRQATRSSDTLARYAGDEFVVLLDPVADLAAAEHIRDKIDLALREPLPVAAMQRLGTAFLGASVGVAIYPGMAVDAEDLVRLADADMYRRKT